MNMLLIGSILASVMLLAGSIVPLIKRGYSEQSLHRLMAFGSGVLLGTAFLHLIPEASKSDPLHVGYGLALAFLLIFGVEHGTLMHACHKYYHEYMEHPEQFHSKMSGVVSIIAFLLHSLLDGLALAASFAVSASLGMATAMAVLIHQFPIGVSLSSIFLHTATAPKAAQEEQNAGANQIEIKGLRSDVIGKALLVAVSIPFGAVSSSPWIGKVGMESLALILGFSAGSFIYIGATDILPEVHHKHDIWCFICFTLGIGIMFLAKQLGFSG